MNEQRNGNLEEEAEALTGEIMSGAIALEAVDRAAIDVQISTAKAYPRSITSFQREAKELACLDEETAAACFYALPRGGKRIEGPSIRLAEIAAYSWGNIRVDARIQAVEHDRVVAVGTAFDCERNSGSRIEIPRSIVGKNGRFNADMINVTCRAAIAIARREAILAVIPRAYINPIYLAARKASLGKGGTTEQKRQNALDWFAKLGVEPERVFEALGVKGAEDVGEDELITLRGLRTAIQEGETTVEQSFPRAGSEPGQAGSLNDKLHEWKKKSPADSAKGRSGNGKTAAPEAGVHPEPELPANDSKSASITFAEPAAGVDSEDEDKSPAEPDAVVEGSPGNGSPDGEDATAGEEAGDDPEDDYEALARLDAQYQDLLLEYRPLWTLRDKRMFELTHLGAPDDEWTLDQYKAAIKLLSAAGPLESAPAAAPKKPRAKAKAK